MESVSAVRSLSTFRTLTDRQVVNALTTIAIFERAAIARLVAILAEFDDRKLYLPLGFTSLFAYCTSRLGLSQDEAFHRIEAARLARTFPVILGYLEKGALNLTTIRLLGKHLTSDNHLALLDGACHQKRPEVDMLIARLRPRPDVPSTIRKLPTLRPGTVDMTPPSSPPASPHGGPEIAQALGSPSPPAHHDTREAAAETSAHPRLAPQTTGSDVETSTVSRATQTPHRLEIPARRPILAPLSDTSYRLQITLDKHSHDNLRELQALMRHTIPSGDPAAIVARALDALLTLVRRKKFSDVPERRSRGGPKGTGGQKSGGRRIPANVQREVWNRDAGRCAFVSTDGVRCDADGFVEFHHVRPFARGGAATVANIQLRCRAHNQHEAEIAGLGRRLRRAARQP